MLITIDIPDGLMTEFEAAIVKHDAGENPFGLKSQELIQREAIGWIKNLVLMEYGQVYQKTAEDSLKSDVERVNELSRSSLPKGK